MIITTKIYDASKGQFVTTHTDVLVVLKTAVATANQLPTTGNLERDGRYASDTNHFYVYLNGKWNDTGYLPDNTSTPVVPPVTPGTAGNNLDIPEENIVFKSSVATVADLPTSGNTENDAVFTRDSNHLYIYFGGEFVDQGVFDFSDLVEDYIFQAIS